MVLISLFEAFGDIVDFPVQMMLSVWSLCLPLCVVSVLLS